MIRIQSEDFSLAGEVARLTDGRADMGAIVTFTGTVRDMFDDQPLVAMTLEHYPGMTERELTRIEETARRRWQLLDCLVIHRIGRLLPGEQIVLVITLSAHRGDAFEAAQFIMDYLKTSAPFWKKEETAAGTAWVEAKASDDTAMAQWSSDDE